MSLHQKKTFDFEILVQPLQALLELDKENCERQIRCLHPYAACKLIETLQQDQHADRDLIMKIEWNFLGLLREHRGQPVTLYRQMSADPSFFVDILALSSPREALSNKGENEEDGRNESGRYNAEKLLKQWRELPGKNHDGSIDHKKLQEWIDEARIIAKQRELLAKCDSQIGSLLVSSPINSGGSWLTQPIREIIEKLATDDLASGMYYALMNSRGFMWGDSQGARELDLSKKYHEEAQKIRYESPFTAKILTEVSKYYSAIASEAKARAQWHDH